MTPTEDEMLLLHSEQQRQHALQEFGWRFPMTCVSCLHLGSAHDLDEIGECSACGCPAFNPGEIFGEENGRRNHVIAMFLTVVFLLGAGFAAGFFFGRLDAIDEACAEKPAIIFEICE